MRAILTILGVLVLTAGVSPRLHAQAARAPLAAQLQAVYGQWRDAMMKGNLARWQANTSRHRKAVVRNRIYSERRSFPGALFDIPVAPPDATKLRALRVEAKGPTAKVVYFGKVDFGVGGAPTSNLLVMAFTNEQGRWKYDGAEFVNLSALPDVRKALAAGDLSYVKTADFAPSGVVPPVPFELRGPAKYITKVYVYCPGREVQVMINKISRHKFQNTKAAEIVVGGARDGLNEIQYTAKRLPGSEGIEPMAIRVYVLSQVPGTKPITAFEYNVPEKGKVKGAGSADFNVTPEISRKILGR